MMRIINEFSINRANRMNAKHVNREISSLGQTDIEESVRVSAACRLPEKSRNKLKEGAVKSGSWRIYL